MEKKASIHCLVIKTYFIRPSLLSLLTSCLEERELRWTLNIWGTLIYLPQQLGKFSKTAATRARGFMDSCLCVCFWLNISPLLFSSDDDYLINQCPKYWLAGCVYWLGIQSQHRPPSLSCWYRSSWNTIYLLVKHRSFGRTSAVTW